MIQLNQLRRSPLFQKYQMKQVQKRLSPSSKSKLKLKRRRLLRPYRMLLINQMTLKSKIQTQQKLQKMLLSKLQTFLPKRQKRLLRRLLRRLKRLPRKRRKLKKLQKKPLMKSQSSIYHLKLRKPSLNRLKKLKSKVSLQKKQLKSPRKLLNKLRKLLKQLTQLILPLKYPK